MVSFSSFLCWWTRQGNEQWLYFFSKIDKVVVPLVGGLGRMPDTALRARGFWRDSRSPFPT